MSKELIELNRQEMRNVTLNVSENVVKKDMKSFSIMYSRGKSFPALPKSLSDVQTAFQKVSETLITNHRESVLFMNHAETNIAYFETKSN